MRLAASASSEVRKCAPCQELTSGQCNDVKFVIIDAARMPFIARNISTAWQAGQPGMLTKDGAAEAANWRKVCATHLATSANVRDSYTHPHGRS
jgi:hypothetical protein